MEWWRITIVTVAGLLILTYVLTGLYGLFHVGSNPDPSDLEDEEGERSFKEFMESQGLNGDLPKGR